MNKHHTLPGLAMAIIVLSIISCSKSETPTPVDPPVAPKRLTEIWFHKNQPDVQGVKLEYDSQGRITKRTNAVDPTNYEIYTYS